MTTARKLLPQREAFLASYVEAVNQLNGYAQWMYRHLWPIFEPRIGCKITKKDGTLLKEIQEEIAKLRDTCPFLNPQSLLLPFRMSQMSSSVYSLGWTLTISKTYTYGTMAREYVDDTSEFVLNEREDQSTLYYELSLYLGNIRDHVLTDLKPIDHYDDQGTAYTVEQINQLRAKVAEAEEALIAAKDALPYPFRDLRY